MREHEAELAAHGVRVYAVTFESATRVRSYRARATPAFPILRDPRRAGYHAFGLGRGARRRIWAPRTLWFYARELAHGRLPHPARSDWRQLGGDALLDARATACWVYRSREPADRPRVEALVDAVKRRCAAHVDD